MRKAYVLMIVLVMFLAVLSVLSRSPAEGHASTAPLPGKIAVCNITEVFNQYVKAKELAAAMAEKRQALQRDDDKRAKTIRDMELILKALKPGSEEHEKRALELVRLRAERQTWAQIENLKLRREYNRKTAEMYAEIMAVASDVAASSGIAIVLQTQTVDVAADGAVDPWKAIGLRQVLYSHPSADITRKVVAELNDKHRAGSAK